MMTMSSNLEDLELKFDQVNKDCDLIIIPFPLSLIEGVRIYTSFIYFSCMNGFMAEIPANTLRLKL